jgi:hypothetical protein
MRRTKNRLETVGAGETVDGMTGSTNALDGAAKRNDQRLHLLLVNRLDEGIERRPSGTDNIGNAVVEETNELADEVDDVVGEVGFGGLAETGEEAATGDALRGRLVLAQAEHVHL